jgi:hypothetical protein
MLCPPLSPGRSCPSHAADWAPVAAAPKLPLKYTTKPAAFFGYHRELQGRLAGGWFGRHLIHPIDFAEFLQKLWVTIIEANDPAELGAVSRFVLYDFAPTNPA